MTGVWLRPVVLRDPKAAHQIVLSTDSYHITVSCNCAPDRPLAGRTRWLPHEPLQVWLAHMRHVRGGA